MNESFEEAREELKRADHLIFVSLKYTRTVDVIKSVVERLMNSFSFTIDALLQYYHKKKKIEIPKNPGQKVEALKKINPDQRISELLDFYLFLRKVLRAEYQRSREYRRHVTMTVKLEGKSYELNINAMYEYNAKAKEFYTLAENIIFEIQPE